MEILSQNKFSSLGMLLGALALILGIVHFSLGPFSPKPSLQTVVAGQVSAVKKGLIAGITGKQATAETDKKTVDIDKLVRNTGIITAIIALGLAFVGGMRKENRWGITGALVFGGGTLMFHAVLFGIGVICTILFLLLIVSVLNGNLPGL